MSTKESGQAFNEKSRGFWYRTQTIADECNLPGTGLHMDDDGQGDKQGNVDPFIVKKVDCYGKRSRKNLHDRPVTMGTTGISKGFF